MYQKIERNYNRRWFKSKKNKVKLKKIISRFKKKIRTSLFINPSKTDIQISSDLKTDCVELHTGKLANLVKSKKFTNELNKIKIAQI